MEAAIWRGLMQDDMFNASHRAQRQMAGDEFDGFDRPSAYSWRRASIGLSAAARRAGK